MEKRKFYVYLVPKIVGGQEREIVVNAINYQEAESLVADEIRENEFICRIEQAFEF